MRRNIWKKIVVWCKSITEEDLVAFLKFTGWELSGLQLVWEKIHPPENPRRKSPSIVLWIISIYIGMYSLAETRRQIEETRLQNRLNVVAGSLGYHKNGNKSLELLPGIQNTEIAVDPDIFNPISVYRSFVREKTKSQLILNQTYNILCSRTVEGDETLSLDGIDITCLFEICEFVTNGFVRG